MEENNNVYRKPRVFSPVTQRKHLQDLYLEWERLVKEARARGEHYVNHPQPKSVAAGKP